MLAYYQQVSIFTQFRSTIVPCPDNSGFGFSNFSIGCNGKFEIWGKKLLKIKNYKFQKSATWFCEEEENAGVTW